MRWRARTIVHLHCALRASRPQLKRDPLGVQRPQGFDVHPAIKTFLIGAAVVLAFDAAGATASQLLGFRYSILTIGTYVIYLAITYRSGKRFGVLVGVATGAALGLVDSTLGWAISWAIGPGRPTHPMSGAAIAGAILFVVALGAALGILGAAVGRTIGAGR